MKSMNHDASAKESLLSTVTPSTAIVRLAVPATLALLAKAVYNIVDTAYIGMLGDDSALAAVGATLPLLLIMVSIENIFAAAPRCWPAASWARETGKMPAGPSPPL